MSSGELARRIDEAASADRIGFLGEEAEDELQLLRMALIARERSVPTILKKTGRRWHTAFHDIERKRITHDRCLSIWPLEHCRCGTRHASGTRQRCGCHAQATARR
jgi:hypothetical protein